MYTAQISFGIALAAVTLSAQGANPSLQPISARFAQTQTDFSVELGAYSFSELELEEADEFDGWTAGLEFVAPLGKLSEKLDTMQLRLLLPVYADGDARVTDTSKPDFGEKIDIDGNGGVFDFTTLQFEHQLFHLDKSGFNAAYTVGWGQALANLDTSTQTKDKFNHTGGVILAGVKFDRPVSIFGSESQLILNGGIRAYYGTDDLHPDDSDNFTFADLRGAVVFEEIGGFLVPVVELTYLGEFGDYDELLLRPEVIIPVNEDASLKLGGIVSLSDDGNQGGFAGSFSFSF